MLNYSSMKLEFLALKWAVSEKFRKYLLGAKFVVFTDNNPLSYLHTAKLNAVEQCWSSQLALFDFEIKYHPGTANRNADALSHLPRSSAPDIVQAVLSGITVLPTLARIPTPTFVNHATALEIEAVPAQEKADVQALQVADSHLGAFLRYWRRGQPPHKD